MIAGGGAIEDDSTENEKKSPSVEPVARMCDCGWGGGGGGGCVRERFEIFFFLLYL
jgi:hypothetical protein